LIAISKIECQQVAGFPGVYRWLWWFCGWWLRGDQAELCYHTVACSCRFEDAATIVPAYASDTWPAQAQALDTDVVHVRSVGKFCSYDSVVDIRICDQFVAQTEAEHGGADPSHTRNPDLLYDEVGQRDRRISVQDAVVRQDCRTLAVVKSDHGYSRGRGKGD
jgi:hypothetical protein